MAHPQANHSGTQTETFVTVAAVALSIVASVFLTADLVGVLGALLSAEEYRAAVLQGTFIAIIFVMQFSVFVYLVTRLSQLERHGAHRPPAEGDLEWLQDESRAPTVAALVPSYKEDVRVIRRTLLSAALLDYPNKRVVLLIDNPPDPSNREDRELLEDTRRLVPELDEWLRSLSEPYTRALADYLLRRAGPLVVEDELRRLAGLYDAAAAALTNVATGFADGDHEDRCFVAETLEAPAQAYRARASALRSTAARGTSAAAWSSRILGEYQRLAGLFRASIASFERKRFVNLSHEPNKAMNLNTYLALMGRVVSEDTNGRGRLLNLGAEGDPGVLVADAQYVLTLDADSVLHPAYLRRLVDFVEQPENARVAVVQTPYSAFPGAPGALEQVAGATTDIQYLVHQGFTRYNATFWVGANALLRKRALEDIATRSLEQGFPVTRFIHDNTVIEDTESSVDLVCRDWRLHNYPERLAWSATPGDFGALLIQRRRWANGGLIILPKFLRYVFRRARVPQRWGHAAMGGHYLTSLASNNIGLIALLALPFEAPMRSGWLPLALGVYFALYTRDLVRIGYRARDVANVYALTLLLVPVHLGGVMKSVQQMLTKQRTPFGRTPKVQDRTAVPLAYLAGVYALLAGCLALLIRDLSHGLMLHSLFTLLNTGFLLYAVVRFVGLRNSLTDFKVAVAGWLPSAGFGRGEPARGSGW